MDEESLLKLSLLQYHRRPLRTSLSSVSGTLLLVYSSHQQRQQKQQRHENDRRSVTRICRSIHGAMLLEKASAVPFENVTITELNRRCSIYGRISTSPRVNSEHAQVMRRLSTMFGWPTSNGHSFLARNGRATREWK